MKKTVSVLENGFLRAMADDGAEDLGDTNLLKSLNGSNNANVVIPAEFNQNFKKYFNVVKDSTKVCSNKDKYCRFVIKKFLDVEGTPGCSARAYYLNDGSIVGFVMNSDGMTKSNPSSQQLETKKSIESKGLFSKAYARVYIDVDGEKGPAQQGRDIFTFMLAPNGKLYPAGSKQYVVWDEYYQYGNQWDNRGTWNTTWSAYNACLGAGSSGFSCPARIIADGWQMNY